MANAKRSEKIAHWLELGPEKMAESLWVLWQRNQNLKREAQGMIFRRRCDDAQQQAKLNHYDTLLRQNEILKDVLQDAGIRPKRLEVSYIERDCEHCEAYDKEFDACTSEAWYEEDEEDCKYKNVTATVAFYAYKIDNDMLEGITADFEHSTFDAIEVRDAKTGRVIYQYEKDEKNVLECPST